VPIIATQPNRAALLAALTSPLDAGTVCKQIAREHDTATRGGPPMHVSLSALEKALRLVDDLAETDDPADFGERASRPGPAYPLRRPHL
jgi:hypothetical protein